MKKSELSFIEGFTTNRSRNNNPQKAFDWDKAASLIVKYLKIDKDIIASAGLQGDWDHTGGIIFENGKPTNENYTFLSSNWAIPTLIIENLNGDELLETPCFTQEDQRFHMDTKWDEKSLLILGINF